jgi:YgiT-type zinc finger domain-containing protein
VCPHCQTGTLHLRRVVFAHWHGGQFITIPNFPGWVCDVCGEREYDSVALDQVQTILGAEQDLRRATSRRSKRGPRGHYLPPRMNGGRV